VFKKATYPLLIDGGALSFLATKEGRKALQSRQSTEALAVLTPHAGEAARLAQAANVEAANPYELSAKLANVYHSLVVLKGPETIISDGLRTEIFTYGTPSLAKAGTGDVLSGIIGGLLAQGLSEFDAAYLGVSLHAKAAKIAANSLTEVCVCAEEVLEALPQAFHAYLSMLEQ
jgi:hydroxyethylthiazole kinase-like uncharacterized protein yjeF